MGVLAVFLFFLLKTLERILEEIIEDLRKINFLPGFIHQEILIEKNRLFVSFLLA